MIKLRVVFLSLVSLLFIGLASTAHAQFYFVTPPQIGQPAPDFKLKDIEGKEVTLSQIRQGKRAIVFFWATWCPHCRKELKNLNEQQENLEKMHIKLAVIALGESADVVKKYLEKQKISLNVILDEKEVYADEYGIVGVPTLFFVDEGGIMRDVQHALSENLEQSFIAH